VEPGEDVEACVRREMREEAGLRIGEVRYMATQPWPFPHSLMIGCWAEALTTELTLEEAELWDARWFTRAEVRAMLEERHAEGITVPGAQSIAHALIRSFVESKEPPA
jgi:NAD+ diphosphatase